MATVSEYNQSREFSYDFSESRLRKCAKLIQSLPHGVALDIGCATGDWAYIWRHQGWHVSGIDIDRAYVFEAQEHDIDAQFCDLNTDQIPFPDATFDLVFAGEVIEHIVDTDRFLSEVSRCTKMGGHFIITTPNLASFENRVRLLLGIYPIWLNYNLQGSGHVRGYTPRALRKQMAVHGLKVIKHLGNWVPFLPQRIIDDVKLPVLSFTGDLFPNFAMDIIFMAVKTTSP